MDFEQRLSAELPHWELTGATYSITFRLYDSLPLEVLARGDGDLRELEQRLDAALDRHDGSAYMRNTRVADVVARTLTFFDEVRYSLYAWCVMPNHVHALVQPLDGWTLARILHSWKSYSSKKANELLGREGRFWQREYFDRIIRNEEDLEQTVSYVLANPAKSGLEDWPFTSAGWKPADRPAGRRRSVV